MRIASATEPQLKVAKALTSVDRAHRDPFTLALLLPDGVGFRNFMFGSFLKEASKVGHIHLFHLMEDGWLPFAAARDHKSVHWHSLLPFTERPVPFFIRQILMAAQRRWIDTPPNRRALNRAIHGT